MRKSQRLVGKHQLGTHIDLVCYYLVKDMFDVAELEEIAVMNYHLVNSYSVWFGVHDHMFPLNLS